MQNCYEKGEQNGLPIFQGLILMKKSQGFCVGKNEIVIYTNK